MTFWEAFFRTLRWRPRQALAGLYWHLTRRRVRARNRLRQGTALAPHAYDYWIETVEDDQEVVARLPAEVEGWVRRPKFAMFLHDPVGSDKGKVLRTTTSAMQQYYPDWTLIIASADGDGPQPEFRDQRVVCLDATGLPAGEAVGLATATTDADFLLPLRAGQMLAPTALFRFAAALQDAEPSIIYADQDRIDRRGKRSSPWLKPKWDPEMFLAQDYLSGACAIDVGLVRTVMPITESCDEAAIYALLLKATSAAPRDIVHLPFVLSHLGPDVTLPHQSTRVATVARHLHDLDAKAAPGPFDTVKVSWPLPEERPAVSIIIPTRDKVNLLQACVSSVLYLTRYPNFEVIIADNGSVDPKALAYLAEIGEQPNVRVISYDHPYNYSAINNYAAQHARSPYLCLLNNDTEVISPEWLTDMMRQAVRPHVGAVGAQLLYEDGTIQHAGVIVGICEAAGHAHRFTPSDKPGYFGQPHITHAVSAVTAACLVVEKRKFDEVGGLDAEGLPVAFNDVDLCLKLEQAGWKNIYVPHAALLHYESKSRGQDTSPEKLRRYMSELAVLQERWGTKSYDDPRHHINLDRSSESFILRI